MDLGSGKQTEGLMLVLCTSFFNPRRHEQELSSSRLRLPGRIANGAPAPAESLNKIESKAGSGFSSHKTIEDRHECVIMLAELQYRYCVASNCSARSRMLNDVYATGRGTSDVSCG